MDNERPNERTTWSRRLEEPGALPGLTDREGAWDKLYDRLKDAEAPRRQRRMIWFWAAAACILLMVIPAALLLKDQHRGSNRDARKSPIAVNPGDRQDHSAHNPGSQPSRTTDNSGSRPGQIAVTPEHIRPGANDSAAQGPSTPSSLTLSDPPRPAHPNGITHPSPNTHPALNPPPYPGPHQASITHPTPAIYPSPGQRKDSLTLVFTQPDLSKPPVIAAAASKPPKKELRVVHINEIQPSQPTPAMAIGPRAKPGGLQVGLSDQETFRPSTTYAEQEGHSIITFKHAQNP